jgi:hypothetical protein
VIPAGFTDDPRSSREPPSSAVQGRGFLPCPAQEEPQEMRRMRWAPPPRTGRSGTPTTAGEVPTTKPPTTARSWGASVEAAGVETGASQPAAFVTCFFSYTYCAAFAVCATRVPFEDLGSKLRPHHPWERRPAHTCEPSASPGRFRGWALPPSLNFTETLDAILRP